MQSTQNLHVTLILCGLFNGNVSSSEYIALERWIMNWKGSRGKWLWPNLKYYPSNCLEGLNKIRKVLRGSTVFRPDLYRETPLPREEGTGVLYKSVAYFITRYLFLHIYNMQLSTNYMFRRNYTICRPQITLKLPSLLRCNETLSQIIDCFLFCFIL
jgi:hypothetical protein